MTDIVDCMESLITLMENETEELKIGRGLRDGGQIADAKGRLVAVLEKEIAKLNRRPAEWALSLEVDDRERLAELIRRVEKAALENAAMIQRSLRLSAEMIDAVSAEARRVSGGRSVSYHRSGALNDTSRSAPISVNTAL